MKYCTKCYYPETKPDLSFNESGECSACTAFEARKSIDWETREVLFRSIVMEIKRFNNPNHYDVVVPVSGGKDSHYQVMKCMDYGLNVLAVNARTDDLTPLGRKNLDNIGRMCDLIEVAPNREVRKRINKYTLQTVGDISWAEHVTIFSIPYRIAVEKNINYIIWGENPQNEYGGPLESQGIVNLDERWLSEFGGLNSLRVKDLILRKILSYTQAEIYRFPPFPDLNQIKGLFLGNYFPWDGYQNFIDSQLVGFEPSRDLVENSGFNYENLDNYQTGIHDYFKYLKFGFGRATDIVNNHIRRGKMSRIAGLNHILKWEGGFPTRYLGKSYLEILDDINMTENDFKETCYEFANKTLFDRDLNPLFLNDLDA